MEGYNIQESTMRDYMRVLFRQKSVFLTAFITVMATVGLGLEFKTPVYQAQAKMLISAEKEVSAPYYRDIMGYRNVELALTQSEVVTSNPVIERAVKATGLYQMPLDYETRFASQTKIPFIKWWADYMNKRLSELKPEQRQAYLFRMTVENLKSNIKVEPMRDTNVFTISVRDYSPIGAAILANVVSRSYVIFDLEQQLAELQLKYGDRHLSVAQMKDNIKNMEKGLNGEPVGDIEAIGPASVKIIEQAQIPIRPAGIPKALTMVLAFFMSLFLGVMLAFAFEYMDQTLKTPQDVERFLNIPFLGFVPKRGRRDKILIKDAKRETGYTRFYNNLSDQLYMLLKDKKLKSILMTSALPREGASTIIANLGIYLAQKAGRKVLIIDANLRGPSIYKILNLKMNPGLPDVIEGRIPFDRAIQETGSKLAVLTAGTTELNPITIVDSKAMMSLIHEAKERYEVVLIDCADIAGFKDALALSSCVDGVAMVVNEGKTRRQVVKAAVTQLLGKNANLLGVILNNRTFVIPRIIYDRV